MVNIKSRKNNKVNFHIVKNDNESVSNENNYMFTIENHSFRDIRYLKFYINLYNIQKLKYFNSGSEAGFCNTTIINKKKIIPVLDNKKDVLNENILYKIVKRHFKDIKTTYVIRIEFICLNNNQRVDFDIFYYLGDSDKNSQVLKISKG